MAGRPKARARKAAAAAAAAATPATAATARTDPTLDIVEEALNLRKLLARGGVTSAELLDALELHAIAASLRAMVRPIAGRPPTLSDLAQALRALAAVRTDLRENVAPPANKQAGPSDVDAKALDALVRSFLSATEDASATLPQGHGEVPRAPHVVDA